MYSIANQSSLKFPNTILHKLCSQSVPFPCYSTCTYMNITDTSCLLFNLPFSTVFFPLRRNGYLFLLPPLNSLFLMLVLNENEEEELFSLRLGVALSLRSEESSSAILLQAEGPNPPSGDSSTERPGEQSVQYKKKN